MAPQILVVGITGNIGPSFIDAAQRLDIVLHVLMRPDSMKDPIKQALVEGSVVHEGSLDDYPSLLAACQGMDAVISLVGSFLIPLQENLIRAAKEAGVKRFVPSEFSCSLTHPRSVHVLSFEEKTAIRKLVQASGMEWTSIQSNGFMEFFAPGCFNMLAPAFPETVEIYGDGNVKLGMTSYVDVALVALRAVQDPRAANTHLIISLPGTLYTQNEMVELWEQISGTKVKRTFLSEEEAEKRLEESDNNPSRSLEALTLKVVRGYVFNQLAMCELREGELRAEELYPDFQNVTLRQFYENIVNTRL